MPVTRFLFRKAAQVLAGRKIYLTKSLTYQHAPAPLPANFDYVRYATLGLCAEEIRRRDVPGNLAEVGVYRGDFAQRLNQLFPQRTLYLFDTFTGFSAADVATEQRRGYSTGTQSFADTSAAAVLARMPYPARCVVRQGFFPATAAGLEADTFCLVSLDADLYDPILAGLHFFYPRLSPGGYLFVHDFNNDEYRGARQAVLDFCASQRIGYLPLPDSGGTAVISK